MPFSFSQPPISVSTAHAFAAFFAFSYVGSLYLSKNARLKFKRETSPGAKDGEEREKELGERWRNDPDVIRARLIAAILSTVVSVCVVVWLVRRVIPADEVRCFYFMHEALRLRFLFHLGVDAFEHIGVWTRPAPIVAGVSAVALAQLRFWISSMRRCVGHPGVTRGRTATGAALGDYREERKWMDHFSFLL